MIGDRDTSGAGAAHPDGVAGCGTGPAGRSAFVGRELTDLWRELRARTTRNAQPTPGPDTDKDIEK